jgi:predicted nucleic acid-binding Zn ribbon protein
MMPTYDYYCETNGVQLEVRHAMNLQVATWGELSNLAGIDAGETPVDAPVKKLITAAALVSRSALTNPEPACGGGGCSGGACGL